MAFNFEQLEHLSRHPDLLANEFIQTEGLVISWIQEFQLPIEWPSLVTSIQQLSKVTPSHYWKHVPEKFRPSLKAPLLPVDHPDLLTYIHPDSSEVLWHPDQPITLSFIDSLLSFDEHHASWIDLKFKEILQSMTPSQWAQGIQSQKYPSIHLFYFFHCVPQDWWNDESLSTLFLNFFDQHFKDLDEKQIHRFPWNKNNPRHIECLKQYFKESPPYQGWDFKFSWLHDFLSKSDLLALKPLDFRHLSHEDWSEPEIQKIILTQLQKPVYSSYSLGLDPEQYACLFQGPYMEAILKHSFTRTSSTSLFETPSSPFTQALMGGLMTYMLNQTTTFTFTPIEHENSRSLHYFERSKALDSSRTSIQSLFSFIEASEHLFYNLYSKIHQVYEQESIVPENSSLKQEFFKKIPSILTSHLFHLQFQYFSYSSFNSSPETPNDFFVSFRSELSSQDDQGWNLLLSEFPRLARPQQKIMMSYLQTYLHQGSKHHYHYQSLRSKDRFKQLQDLFDTLSDSTAHPHSLSYSIEKATQNIFHSTSTLFFKPWIEKQPIEDQEWLTFFVNQPTRSYSMMDYSLNVEFWKQAALTHPQATWVQDPSWLANPDQCSAQWTLESISAPMAEILAQHDESFLNWIEHHQLRLPPETLWALVTHLSHQDKTNLNAHRLAQFLSHYHERLNLFDRIDSQYLHQHPWFDSLFPSLAQEQEASQRQHVQTHLSLLPSSILPLLKKSPFHLSFNESHHDFLKEKPIQPSFLEKETRRLWQQGLDQGNLDLIDQAFSSFVLFYSHQHSQSYSKNHFVIHQLWNETPTDVQQRLIDQHPRVLEMILWVQELNKYDSALALPCALHSCSINSIHIPILEFFFDSEMKITSFLDLFNSSHLPIVLDLFKKHPYRLFDSSNDMDERFNIDVPVDLLLLAFKKHEKSLLNLASLKNPQNTELPDPAYFFSTFQLHHFFHDTKNIAPFMQLVQLTPNDPFMQLQLMRAALTHNSNFYESTTSHVPSGAGSFDKKQALVISRIDETFNKDALCQAFVDQIEFFSSRKSIIEAVASSPFLGTWSSIESKLLSYHDLGDLLRVLKKLSLTTEQQNNITEGLYQHCPLLLLDPQFSFKDPSSSLLHCLRKNPDTLFHLTQCSWPKEISHLAPDSDDDNGRHQSFFNLYTQELLHYFIHEKNPSPSLESFILSMLQAQKNPYENQAILVHLAEQHLEAFQSLQQQQTLKKMIQTPPSHEETSNHSSAFKSKRL